MLHLCRNQVVDFNQQNVLKTPVDDLYLKYHSSAGVFQTFC